MSDDDLVVEGDGLLRFREANLLRRAKARAQTRDALILRPGDVDDLVEALTALARLRVRNLERVVLPDDRADDRFERDVLADEQTRPEAP